MNGTDSTRKEYFLPIEDYGVIGNLNTVALVSLADASIDHFCFPHFDSPLIFGRLLTSIGGGYFQITPACGKWTPKQLYLPSSNVLVTRFLGADGGIGQVTDFLPVCKDITDARIADDLIKLGVEIGNDVSNVRPRQKSYPWLVRKVETIRGSLKYRAECQPAFNYGQKSHSASISDCKTAKFSCEDGVELELSGHLFCHDGKDSCTFLRWRTEDEQVTYETGLSVSMPKVFTEFELGEQDSIFILLRQPDDDNLLVEMTSEINGVLLQRLLHATTGYWHDWLQKCTYKGRWREMVERSALMLKLMTFAPTGAIIAAPTTSLPEQLGGKLNWDYRFTWIRDAAFTVYAFLRIGLTEEAADFMLWIEKRCTEVAGDDAGGLRLMYDIRGAHPTLETCSGRRDTVLASEVTLQHWTGYRDSAPVRIGNLAALQQQLDIYGELLDAIYLCDKHVRPISYDFWCILRDYIVPQVVRRWQEPDHGIWECREEPQHYVYSKVMAWVALDRVIRLANKRSLPAPLDVWKATRDAIYEEVMECGYNKNLQVFTQYYGSEHLDASNLIMPLVFFLPPDDPRFLQTLKKTLMPVKSGGLTINHLVFRYHGDPAVEGTFSICSFWLVEALARAGTRRKDLLDKGRVMFEDIIGYANHLGLFSEEIGLDGSALGNFPQAFTHLSLISAAYNLDRVLN